MTCTDKKGAFHYWKPDDMPDKIQETDRREVNDFCPRVQLQKLIDGCGDPDVQVSSNGNEQIVHDKNDVWRKISDGLPEFITQCTGTDPHDVVMRTAKELFMTKLLKCSKKIAELQTNLSMDCLFASMTGSLIIIRVRS